MIINSAAIKRQTTVLALLVLLVLAGVFSYMTLPRESFPDITIPYVFVSTNYEGVAPSDMEQLVTIPIERKLKGLSDTEEINSLSAEGSSTISIKFLPSVDIDDALQKVKDKVDQAKSDLPDDLPNDPTVTEANFQDIPVIYVVLSGPFSLRRLKVFAEDFEDQIEGIAGVLETQTTGGLEREIHVEFDLDRVGAYNMPFSSLISAVDRGNVNMPGGSMNIGKGKYTVRVPEDYQHPADIFSIVAFVRDGKPVYLRDVASIVDSYKEPTTRSRINLQPSVTIGVKKRSGENIVQVCDEVKAIVERLRPNMPPELKIDITSDQSQEVRRMLKDLQNNILTGLVLVLVVIFIFIGGRSALFVALAIPYSMLITFVMLDVFSISLNMVVLFSLILALGMLVDNGIVIVENIYRHMQEGKSRREAAQVGTDEVAWPVITSTLTTLAAFIPLLFWPGIMGEFMGFMPRTLIIALTASLFVAMVINPVLSARYQTAKQGEAVPPEDERALAVKMPFFKRLYYRFLRLALRFRFSVILLSLVMLVAVIVAFAKFGAGLEFFPQADPERATVEIKAPVGTNLDASDELVSQVEEIVKDYKDIDFIISQIGSEGGSIFSRGTGTHLSSVSLDFKDFQDRSQPSPVTVNQIRKRVLAAIKGAEVRVEREEHGPPTGEPVNLEISGPELDVLGQLTEQIRQVMNDIPGLTDVKDNYSKGKPEVRVRVDKEKAALLGLDTFTIAYVVKTAINGSKVGVYREGKEEYDIVAKLPEKDRQSVESLKRLTVSGSKGEPIPITSVAGFELTTGLGSITRKDQKRVITISGKNTGRLPEVIIKDLEGELRKMTWPKGYAYKFTGEKEEQAKAQVFLAKAFVATLFLILIILMTQFDSLVYPLIVITSVVLSLIGVFFGLVVTHMPFGVIMTGIGVISLAGVVVNNAIVLIDYYLQLMKRGLSSQKALETAGVTRFRPVLLTAITTVLGLVPMATGISFDFTTFSWEVGSESSQFWAPMAIAVIFGLTVATMLTLVVVPVLCSLANSWHGLFKRKSH